MKQEKSNYLNEKVELAALKTEKKFELVRRYI